MIQVRGTENYMPYYRTNLHQISERRAGPRRRTKGVVNRWRPLRLGVYLRLTKPCIRLLDIRRSQAILEDVLDGFSGVLVAASHAALCSVPVALTECLFTGMRALNEHAQESIR